MRVVLNLVILSDTSDGSRQRDLNVLSELSRELHRRGHELILCIARDASAALQSRIEALAPFAVIHRVPIPSRPTHKRIAAGWFRWRAVMRKCKGDIFHSSYYPLPSVEQRIALTVNDIRFIKFPKTYSFSRRKFLQYAVPRALRKAGLLFSISNWTKDEICKAYDVPESKIFVAPIPADLSFRPSEDARVLDAVRARYKLPERFFLCVGHLEPRKNYARIIEAFRQFKITSSDRLGLVIVGKPNLKWRELIDSAKLERAVGDIVFTGYVPDTHLPDIYGLAEALIFPSLHEGFGIPLLEAMNCGLPIITSNTTAMPEVAGSAALFVDPTSTEQIRDAMLRITSSLDVRSDLQQKGYERIKAFGPNVTARAIADGYEALSLG